jgi:hypothetical protein
LELVAGPPGLFRPRGAHNVPHRLVNITPIAASSASLPPNHSAKKKKKKLLLLLLLREI